MEVMNSWYGSAERPEEYGQKYHAEKTKGIIGYLCSYVPEELILAAGFHPLRLFGAKRNIHLADAHLQGYCCSLVRGVLEEALAGRFSFLSGVVFPHTCDSVQRLSDIWRLKGVTPFHIDLVLPVKLNTESSRQYLRDVLARFKDELEARQGKIITQEDLRQAISLCNGIRSFLKDIYDLKNESPHVISARDLYAINKAAQIMDREELLSHLAATLAELKRKQAQPAETERKRLVLVGGFCDQSALYEMIEDAGSEIVGDDLCTGSRSFSAFTREDQEPLEAIVERYLSRPVCPAKHKGLASRADYLIELVRKRKAQGVIFLHLKFCDPHAFDYPYLKDGLDREKIPSILLELEEQAPGEGQLRTRFEAFLEMI